MNKLIENLLTLLEAQFSTTFKSYEYGKVEIPMTRDLPLITVNPVNTEILNSSNVKDENNFTIEVIVMDNFKKYLDNISGSGNIIKSMQQLVKWVEDRNTDGSVKDTTIIGIIRQNITANGAVLFNNEMVVNYEDFLEADEMPIIKAILTFTAQSRSNRL